MNSLGLSLESILARGIDLCGHNKPDLHKAYAAIYFSVPYHQVTLEQRRFAKNDLFLQMYGGDPTKFNTIDHQNRTNKDEQTSAIFDRLATDLDKWL